jgi:hypothetical protein
VWYYKEVMGTIKPKQKKSRPNPTHKSGNAKNPAPPTLVGIGQQTEMIMENTQTQTQSTFRQSTIQKWSKLANALSRVDWDVAGPILKTQIKGFDTLFPNATSCAEVTEILGTLTVATGKKGIRKLTLFGVENPSMEVLIAEQANWASVDADQLRRALNASFGQLMNQFTEITNAPKRKARATSSTGEANG